MPIMTKRPRVECLLGLTPAKLECRREGRDVFFHLIWYYRKNYKSWIFHFIRATTHILGEKLILMKTQTSTFKSRSKEQEMLAWWLPLWGGPIFGHFLTPFRSGTAFRPVHPASDIYATTDGLKLKCFFRTTGRGFVDRKDKVEFSKEVSSNLFFE